MSELSEKIKSTKVKENEIAVFWLGQAGFLIKDSCGRKIAIDPYLSDCCEREFGFKRLSAKLISPGELDADIVFSTHEHLDHFDVDALPEIMAKEKTRFVGSLPSSQIYRQMGLDENKLIEIDEGKSVDLGWVKLTGVYADHGELAPDAIGVLIDISGMIIYYTGDTAYRPENMKQAIEAKPDIIILPINGAYGNLDSSEAAKLARDTGAKYAIPCHFWTFAVHGGDPQKFDEEMKRIAPQSEAVFFAQGEMKKFSN